MKRSRLHILAALSALAACYPLPAFTQTFDVSLTRTRVAANPPQQSDYWFSLAQNDEDQPAKYNIVYLTSDKTCDAHVTLEGMTYTLRVDSFKLTSLNVSAFSEMKSSGKVEQKAIHAWADSGNLTVYLMSHNPYTSDETFLFPTSQLGKDYVVASYYSLPESGIDYPSEFSVSTAGMAAILTITPSVDIRGSVDSIAIHKAGVAFTEDLPLGTCVQYKAVRRSDNALVDLTGTAIHASSRVQVIGASMCANIPTDYPYCNYICEALPPVTAWGTDYYSAPFVNRTGGDLFRLVGTAAGQKICCYAPKAGVRTVATIDRAYGWTEVFGEDEQAHWYSDKPFLIVQYMMSATWPDRHNGIGDPAMVVLNPVQAYAKNVSVLTPRSVGQQSPYTNYVNVVVANSAIPSTTFDQQPIDKYPSLTVDSHTIYRVGGLTPAVHTIQSDSGIGVYSYGFGYDEAYAAGGPGWRETVDTSSLDTIAPFISYHRAQNCADLIATETTSGIAQISVSDTSNVIVTVDSAASHFGPQSNASVCVVDTFLAASASLTYSDLELNAATATVKYTRNRGTVQITPHPFGYVQLGRSKQIAAFTIQNTSLDPVRLDHITAWDPELHTDPQSVHLPIVIPGYQSVDLNFIFTPDSPDSLDLEVVFEFANADAESSFTSGIGYELAVKTEPTLPTDLQAIVGTDLQLHLSIPNDREGIATFEISSALGEVVYRSREQLERGTSVVIMNTSRLVAGTYFCRVALPTGEHRFLKFIIP